MLDEYPPGCAKILGFCAFIKQLANKSNVPNQIMLNILLSATKNVPSFNDYKLLYLYTKYNMINSKNHSCLKLQIYR